uniref:F-box domain-containing protein n=1 Tax=Caenorhabditis tropicalis TaxID=1561998 RepID=A0A1I7UTI1_9PELO
MDLLRLPLVVLIEVFKNMNFGEKFLISLLSKRARNTLKLTCVAPHLSFQLSKDFYIYTSNCHTVVEDGEHFLIEGEILYMSIHRDIIILHEPWLYKQLLLAGYLLDLFTNSTISIKLFKPTPPASAWEFMKLINQRQPRIKSVVNWLSGDSSEFVPKILDECTEVIDFLAILGTYPDDFVYTPPRPFKAK